MESVTLPVLLSDDEEPRLVPVKVYSDRRSLIAVWADKPHADVFCANVSFKSDPIVSDPSADAYRQNMRSAQPTEEEFSYGQQ